MACILSRSSPVFRKIVRCSVQCCSDGEGLANGLLRPGRVCLVLLSDIQVVAADGSELAICTWLLQTSSTKLPIYTYTYIIICGSVVLSPAVKFLPVGHTLRVQFYLFLTFLYSTHCLVRRERLETEIGHRTRSDFAANEAGHKRVIHPDPGGNQHGQTLLLRQRHPRQRARNTRPTAATSGEALSNIASSPTLSYVAVELSIGEISLTCATSLSTRHQ
jgi:hypothetical protein